MPDEKTTRRPSWRRPAIVLAVVIAGAGASALVLFDRADPAANGAAPSTIASPTGTSVVGRLMAKYRPADLELLSAVSRRSSAPPPPAVYHLLEAARRGADDTELTRIIREEVPGALVRHDCFDWLRKRRGDPPPKAPSLASRVRPRPAR